ncbi:MAG: 3'-5' exonuclease [Chitinophagaceae bacterium]
MSDKRVFTPTVEQQKILEIKEGIHLVLAPPGSGKTELLASRVENAIKSGLKDNEIICLTFTNRAAKGMKERIENKYPNNEIIIGNIHHYCSTFLFQNKLIPLNTSILDEEDADSIIEELKKELGYSPIVNGKPFNVYNPNLLKLATYLKQQKLGFPNEILQLPKTEDIPNYAEAKELCEAYMNIKEAFSFIDFDDLLINTYNTLLNKTINSIYASFKWIQVDEVQDLNPIQWAIIDKIKMGDGVTVYFGDYEQAIFSFMGAKLASLHAIELTCKSNPPNGIHNLQKNFRSPSYLLNIYVDYAKQLLNPAWKKEPVSDKVENAEEGSLKIHKINGTLQKEATYIVENILSKLSSSQDEKTAIIVRYNNTADLISSELNKKGISHFKISGFDLFRRKSIKGLMAFLSILENNFNKLSWTRLYYEFGALKTLKEARHFIQYLFKIGLTPIDFILFENQSSRIINFFETVKSQRLIVFDTETTGIKTDEDDIIQVAAIEIVNGEIKREFEVYIKNNKPLAESEKIHNISKEYLDIHGKSPEIALQAFIDFVGSDVTLIAHNLPFDIDILASNLTKYLAIDINVISNKHIDTLELSKLIHPNLNSYKLENLIEYLKIVGVNSHNALDDVKATASLIDKLYKDAEILVEKHNKFFTDLNNVKILKAFTENFSSLYKSTIDDFNKSKSLNELIDYYFDFMISKGIINGEDYESKEKREVQKLLNHIKFYTKESKESSLKEKIKKFVPEYNSFKESDLYYGKDKIFLSTVYKAKGLEFDNVIVAESTDSTYPSWTSKTQDEILEDARAFYVAMTRTKKRLHITHHNTFVSSWGNTYIRPQSRFISTIEKHFI